MRKTHAAAAIAAIVTASLLLAGCPIRPTYPQTITPIYAATSSGGLFVFDGTAWTNYTTANTANGLKSSILSSVAVFGSGSRATVVVGGDQGVSVYNGSSWWQVGTGLGTLPVNGLVIGSTLYAATAGGVSVLNEDGKTWTNDPSAGSPINGVLPYGTLTYAAADGGLYVYNGTGLETSYTPASGIVSTATKVTAVYVDSSLDIYAGTDKGLGISAVGLGFGANRLPAASQVHAITADQQGNIYVAADTGLYVNGVNSFPGFSDAAALCVFVDGAGTIYAGTPSGLRILRSNDLSWSTELAGQQVSAVTTTAPVYSY